MVVVDVSKVKTNIQHPICKPPRCIYRHLLYCTVCYICKRARYSITNANADQQVGREGGKVQDNRASCENSPIFLYLCRSCSIVPALQQNRVSANRPSMHPSIYFLQLIRGLVAVPAGLAGCSSHPSDQERFPAPLRRP